jgi:hypothetical protein
LSRRDDVADGVLRPEIAEGVEIGTAAPRAASRPADEDPTDVAAGGEGAAWCARVSSIARSKRKMPSPPSSVGTASPSPETSRTDRAVGSDRGPDQRASGRRSTSRSSFVSVSVPRRRTRSSSGAFLDRGQMDFREREHGRLESSREGRRRLVAASGDAEDQFVDVEESVVPLADFEELPFLDAGIRGEQIRESVQIDEGAFELFVT